MAEPGELLKNLPIPDELKRLVLDASDETMARLFDIVVVTAEQAKANEIKNLLLGEFEALIAETRVLDPTRNRVWLIQRLEGISAVVKLACLGRTRMNRPGMDLGMESSAMGGISQEPENSPTA